MYLQLIQAKSQAQRQIEPHRKKQKTATTL